MSKSNVVRLVIFSFLIMYLCFAGLTPQSQVKAKDVNRYCPPMECPFNYRWDFIQCECVCNCPLGDGTCPSSCS